MTHALSDTDLWTAADDRMTEGQAVAASGLPPGVRSRARTKLVALIDAGSPFTVVRADCPYPSVEMALDAADREMIATHSSYWGTLTTFGLRAGLCVSVGRAKRLTTSRHHCLILQRSSP